VGNLAVNEVTVTEPWKCPSCGTEHHCAEATPANITVNVHGSVMSEKTLLEAVQRATRWGR
jgi:hypothetical protein